MPKACFGCSQKLKLSEFYVHPSMADGHVNKCKSCVKSEAKARRAQDVDYYRAYDRKRWADGDKARSPSKRSSECSARWREHNREKIRCHQSVERALRKEVLVRPSRCSKCAAIGKVHGHHTDYSKPLDVQWLCPRCHSLLVRKPFVVFQRRKCGGYRGPHK
jgi:hypothetical protein